MPMNLHLKKGALHRMLKVPEGSPIPEKKLEGALNIGSELERKRAQFAENASHWHHGAAYGGEIPGDDAMFALKDDDEKNAKSKVLKEIMGLADHHMGGKLKGLKKPVAIEASVTKIEPKPGEDMEGMPPKGEDMGSPETSDDELAEDKAQGGMDPDAVSDHDKAMIEALYKKHILGQ